MTPNDFQQMFPAGEKNTAYAQYFIGTSYLASLAHRDATVINVTFEPACRNNWHIHHVAGQILICTAGEGWYQEEGKLPRRLKAGDIVDIPPEVKHWHGAAQDCWFSHLSVTCLKKAPAANGANRLAMLNMAPCPVDSGGSCH